MKIEKPKKSLVPLADALRWRAGADFLFEEKMDGVFKTREIVRADDVYLLAGELMPGGDYFAFDCLAVGNRDLRGEPLRSRLSVLDGLDVARNGIKRPARGAGGEFLEMVLARNGEGVVCKDLSAPYGDMLVAKRQIEVAARLGEPVPGKSSFHLFCADSGRDIGRVSAPGARFYALTPGQIVRVTAFGWTPAGKLREPRLAT